MTKQYMQFNDFKQLILEDEAADKKKEAYWLGAIFWGVKFNKNASGSDIPSSGSINCYVALLDDSKVENKRNEIEKFFKEKLKDEITDNKSEFEIKSLDPNSFSKLELDNDTFYQNKDIYKLYICTPGKFDLEESLDEDKFEKAKNKLFSKCNQLISDYVKKLGIYAQAQLIRGKDQKNEVLSWISRLVHSPQSFGGYNTMIGNKKRIYSTSWDDYLAQHSSTGMAALGAILTKGIANLTKGGSQSVKQGLKDVGTSTLDKLKKAKSFLHL